MAFHFDADQLDKGEFDKHEIIRHCSRSNSRRIVVSELEGGLSVIQLSERHVVKCGFGVKENEANNQIRAFHLINPEVIRIPRIYGFFSDNRNGYIIMEYMVGVPLHKVTDPFPYAARFATVLSHFSQIQSSKPGPLMGGFAQGILWQVGSIAPTSIEEIENYYNTKQFKFGSSKIQLKSYPLILCHLDISPRNILILVDASLCLLDWATAGFYPRIFERCTIQLNIRGKNHWNTRLLELIETLDTEENNQAQLLQHAYFLSERYT